MSSPGSVSSKVPISFTRPHRDHPFAGGDRHIRYHQSRQLRQPKTRIQHHSDNGAVPHRRVAFHRTYQLPLVRLVQRPGSYLRNLLTGHVGAAHLSGTVEVVDSSQRLVDRRRRPALLHLHLSLVVPHRPVAPVLLRQSSLRIPSIGEPSQIRAHLRPVRFSRTGGQRLAVKPHRVGLVGHPGPRSGLHTRPFPVRRSTFGVFPALPERVRRSSGVLYCV